MKTNLGNILCSGYGSCAYTTFIWIESSNGNQDVDNSTSESKFGYGNVFCVGTGSCSNTFLETSNTIFCGAYAACDNSFILGADKLYCVDGACGNSVIRQTIEIYLIDYQGGIDVYSGNVGKTTIYFRGDNAGVDVTYQCSDNDECYIDCGVGSCNNEKTLVYCYGKCFITCRDSNDNDNNRETESSSSCVSIEASTSPTAAPTPRSTEIEKLAKKLSNWFNWILGTLVVSTVLFVIFGFLDARKWRSNELFEWSAIGMCAFYTNDFVSGMSCFFAFCFFFVRCECSLKICVVG